jgi:hypothetical protein
MHLIVCVIYSEMKKKREAVEELQNHMKELWAREGNLLEVLYCPFSSHLPLHAQKKD